QPGNASAAAVLRLARFARRQFAEISLDHLAIFGRHFAREFLHGGGTLFLRQLTPLLGKRVQFLGINIARAAILGQAAVGHRLSRPLGVIVAGLLLLAAVRTAVGVGSRFALRLVF